jgi:hypothetical protein
MAERVLHSLTDRMRDQDTCEYIILAYASDPAHQALSPVVVAARELGSDDARGLMLHVPAVLATAVSEGHLEYIYELFEDWRQVTDDRLDDLFRELRELSSGPLRTHGYGFCSIGDLPRLVNEALKTDEHLRVDG